MNVSVKGGSWAGIGREAYEWRKEYVLVPPHSLLVQKAEMNLITVGIV